MSCLSPEVLSAVVDGEASAEEMAHARACARCAARAEELRAVDAALARLPHAREEASPLLFATLRGLAARRERPRARAWAALGGAVAAAVLAVLAAAPREVDFAEALAEQAIASHLRAFTTGAGTGCEVESDDPGILAEWLGRGFGIPVEVPAPASGRLVGARSCQLFGEATPAVVYRTEVAPVSVFLPRPGTEAFAACQQALGSCIEGRDGQTVCVLPGNSGEPMVIVGAMSATELCEVVRT